MNAGAFPFEANPNPVETSERAARLIDPGFGRVFTDHMVTIRYSDDKRSTLRRPFCIMRKRFLKG
jgi:branched-chain amino acid aminotransferase